MRIARTVKEIRDSADLLECGSRPVRYGQGGPPMNVRVYDQLLKLSEGWPPMLGIVGPMIAFGSEPLHRLVSTRQGAELLDAARESRTSEWSGYYRSSKAWLHGLPEQMIPGWLPFSCEELGNLEATVAEDPTILAKVLQDLSNPSTRAKAQRDLRRYQKGLYKELAGAGVQDGQGFEPESLIGNPAVAFMISVMTPHVLQWRESPQVVFQRVTTKGKAHLAEVNRLLDIDPKLVRDEMLEPILFRPKRCETARCFRLGASSVGKPLKPLKRARVFLRAASFISCVSHGLATPLTAKQIRSLFDLAAYARTGKRGRRERSLPNSDEALRQAICRDRPEWQRWLDPDKTFSEAVRALRGQAA